MVGVLPMHFVLSFCTSDSFKYFIFMGRLFSHPTHKDEILGSVKVWLNVSTWANQTQSCFFTTPFFFVNVGLVVRLKLNFIPVKASIHPGQSKPNHISLLPLALVNVVHVTRFKLNFILFKKPELIQNFVFKPLYRSGAIVKSW
jgi:hypothetical protein